MSASEESSQNAEFNPYRVWLGIPANKLPADHYSLLGLETYESDPDVIESAADKVMAFVKTFQSGKYSKQSQQLLNEIAAARVCLLNEKTKAEYDAQLRAKEPQSSPSQLGMVAPPPILAGGAAPPIQAAAFDFTSADKHSAHDKSKQDKKKGGGAYVKKGSKKTVAPIPFWIWGAGAAALAAIALLLFLGLSGGKKTSDTEIAQNESDVTGSDVTDDQNPNAAVVDASNAAAANDANASSSAANNSNSGAAAAVNDANAANNGAGAADGSGDNSNVQQETAADQNEPVAVDNAENATDVDDDQNDFALQEATAETGSDLAPVYKTEEEREAALKAAAVKTAAPSTAAKPTAPVKPKEITVTGLPFPTAPAAGDRHVLTIDDIEYAFRWIPPGTFTMGSPADETGHQPNETAHAETVSTGFWMLETEVTKEMFASVMATGAPSAALKNHPAASVTWDRSRVFCDKLSRITKLNLVLPSEVQWEYACRAKTTTPYNFGAVPSELCKNANYFDKSTPIEDAANPNPLRDAVNDDGYPQLSPVRSYPPNAWGLYDMHGNVAEWCLYPCSQPIDETKTQLGVSRGGGYQSSKYQCRSAARRIRTSDYAEAGFRFIVRSSDPLTSPKDMARLVASDKTPVDGNILKPGKRPGQRAAVKLGSVVFTFRWCPPGNTIVFKSVTKDVAVTHGFWMLETEVTQEMYLKVMGNNPSMFKGRYNPVEQVSWLDAQAFCKKLSEQIGTAEFYLPTEAQWVHAGRAGQGGYYTTGGETIPIDAANCNADFPCEGLPRGKYLGATRPTGTYPPNAWGLYDIHGNVGEWVYDRYDPQYRAQRSVNLYFDPVGPIIGTTRVIRGGSWFTTYTGARFYGGITQAAQDASSAKTGFRICTFPTGVALNDSPQIDGDVSDLFVNQPSAVDLPEQTSNDFVTLLTLPPTEYPWELSSLGLAQFRQGDASLKFVQTNKSVAAAEWKYQMITKDGEMEVAQLKREGNSLLFRFTDITGYEIAQMIRNTILKIKIGSDTHHIALRKPYLVTDNKFNCFTGKKTYTPNLKYLPKNSLVFYDLYCLDHSPKTSFSTSQAEPINKPGRIAFMLENKPVANIQFDFDLNAGLRTDVVLNSDKTFLNHLAMYSNNLAKANAASTEATTRLAEIKRKLPTERNAKMRAIMMQDSIKAQYLIWAHEFAKNAATASPLLHFEVYVDCDGRRLTIMSVDPKLDNVPPAN
ncbi:MAG: formylglycine-generating enzyme family protein [Thermoguttaceae bacterium]|nr:formylglycine-generating enzyme family protein [Thermoguttaceae bacterium]